eukprot:297309_1
MIVVPAILMEYGNHIMIINYRCRHNQYNPTSTFKNKGFINNINIQPIHNNNNETLTLNLNISAPPIMENNLNKNESNNNINKKDSNLPLGLSALNSFNSDQNVRSTVQLNNNSSVCIQIKR